MKKEHIIKGMKYLAIILGICAFGVFIYPGLYRYDKLDQKYPVMINRITGETKVLYGNTWETVGNVDAQMSAFKEYKEEVMEEIKNRNSDIKNEVLTSISSELESAKKEVIAETTTSINYPAGDGTGGKIDFDAYRNRNYTGDYFGKGDTQDKVKSIMGVPDSTTEVGPFETWYFDLSSVKFENGKVSGWNNASKNLHLK